MDLLIAEIDDQIAQLQTRIGGDDRAYAPVRVRVDAVLPLLQRCADALRRLQQYVAHQPECNSHGGVTMIQRGIQRYEPYPCNCGLEAVTTESAAGSGARHAE